MNSDLMHSTAVNFRITLSSRDIKALMKVSNEIICTAKDRELKVKGPIPMPTKTLRVTTRKSPCGNGTNTFDKFEMRIHKVLIHLHTPSEILKKILSVSYEPEVEAYVVCESYTPDTSSAREITKIV